MTNEEHTTNTGVRKAQERLHIDNTTKSGFNALDSIGKSDSSHERCFTYVASDGSQKKLPIVYPEVSYVTNFLLNEDLPGIYHSSFAIDASTFADRIDEFVVVDPGANALFIDVGAYDLCGVEFLDEALARTEHGRKMRMSSSRIRTMIMTKILPIAWTAGQKESS